jgi:hypothetical protein
MSRVALPTVLALGLLTLPGLARSAGAATTFYASYLGYFSAPTNCTPDESVCSFTGHGSGPSTLGGTTTFSLVGTVRRYGTNAPGGFCGAANGTMTITAASGTLNVSVSFLGCGQYGPSNGPFSLPQGGHFTITGGTGAFAGASGSGVVNGNLILYGQGNSDVYFSLLGSASTATP